MIGRFLCAAGAATVLLGAAVGPAEGVAVAVRGRAVAYEEGAGDVQEAALEAEIGEGAAADNGADMGGPGGPGGLADTVENQGALDAAESLVNYGMTQADAFSAMDVEPPLKEDGPVPVPNPPPSTAGATGATGGAIGRLGGTTGGTGATGPRGDATGATGGDGATGAATGSATGASGGATGLEQDEYDLDALLGGLQDRPDIAAALSSYRVAAAQAKQALSRVSKMAAAQLKSASSRNSSSSDGANVTSVFTAQDDEECTVIIAPRLERIHRRMAKAAEATERTISMPGAGGDDAIADPDGAYALKAAKMDVVDAVNADAKHALERCEQGCTNLDEKSESGRQKALQGAMKKFAKMCPQEAKSVTVEFTDQLKGLLGGIQGGLDGPGKDAGKLQSILIGRQKDTLEQIEAARLAEAKRIEMLKA